MKMERFTISAPQTDLRAPIELYCRYLLKDKPSEIVLTEGEFKAAALLQWGIPALAMPGISAFG